MLKCDCCTLTHFLLFILQCSVIHNLCNFLNASLEGYLALSSYNNFFLFFPSVLLCFVGTAIMTDNGVKNKKGALKECKDHFW